MISATPELRVLVTGGAGFLGRALLRELLKAPLAEPRVLDLQRADSPELSGVVSEVADIRDADAVRDACRGVDVVLHAASQIDWGHAPPGQLAEVCVRFRAVGALGAYSQLARVADAAD